MKEYKTPSVKSEIAGEMTTAIATGNPPRLMKALFGKFYDYKQENKLNKQFVNINKN